MYQHYIYPWEVLVAGETNNVSQVWVLVVAGSFGINGGVMS